MENIEEKNELIEEEYDSMNEPIKSWEEIQKELEDNKEELQEKKYVRLDDDGYYINNSWSISSSHQEDETEVEEFPPEEREQYWSAYRYIDGEWVFDPNKASEIANEVELSLKKENIQLQMQAIKDELNELDKYNMKFMEGRITQEEFDIVANKKEDLRVQHRLLKKELEELGE